MSPVNVPAIGAYIREQREQARISLRQLAQATGVSNPYLSQIERGLRKPSADILQQLAKGLRISAEALYVQAGFLEDRPEGYGVKDAVLADPELTERQRQMLLEIYDSFRNETALGAGEAEDGQSADPAGRGLDQAALTWPELAEDHAAVLAEAAVAEQAVAEQRHVTAKPAAAQARPKRAAPRRATPTTAAGRRAGSKAAAAAEPRSGASSGNGGRAGRARPSTARNR